MRHNTVNCLYGNSVTVYLFMSWAIGIIDAYDKCEAAGYWLIFCRMRRLEPENR